MPKFPSLNKSAFLPELAALPLSLPQPEFQHEGRTFNDCLLLHRLLVTGHEEEVQRRRQELSPSLLSHTCQYYKASYIRKKVSIDGKFIEVQVTVYIKEK